MASSDIIKIGFDYRSSLAQFEKDTNGVFDGISSKAGKQKITIQLDAKDDKVIDKIKELQKLKLDKFTFEFGNSGLKEQLQTFDKLENKINEIINLSKGIGNSSAPIVDVNKSSKEIDKLENKISELNKKYDELQKKSATGGISGKEVNLVDNDEFKKLSQEVSELKDQFDDLKTHMSLLDDYTVPTDRFFELQTQVEATSVKVSNLVDEMTRLSNVQKNIGVETNISLGDSKEQSTEIDLYHNLEKRKVTYDEIIDKIQTIVSLKEKEKSLSKTSDDTKLYQNLYDENDINWAGDTEGTINRISDRLKEIYTKYNGKISLIDENDIQEATYLLDILKGSGESPNLNKSQEKFYQNKKFSNDSLFDNIRVDSQKAEEIDKINTELSETYRWFNQLEGVSLNENIANEIKSLISDMQIGGKTASEYANDLLKIFNIDVGSNSAVEQQNKLQSELKETESQAEKTAQAVNESSSTTPEKDLKDAFPDKDISVSVETATNSIKEENNVLEQNTQKSKENAEAKEKIVNADKKASNVNLSKYNTRLESYNKKTSGYDATIARFEDGGWTSGTYLKNVQAVKNAVKDYKNLLNELKGKDASLVTSEDINKLDSYEKKIKDTIATVTNMSASEKGYNFVSGQKELDKIHKLLAENSKMSSEAKAKIRAYYAEIESGNPSMSLDKIHGEILKIYNAEVEAGRAGKTLWDTLKNSGFHQIAAQMAGMFGVYDVINLGKQAFSTVKELDYALVDLKKTTAMNSSELEQFYYDSNDVAKQMGVTTKEIIDQASSWSRLGYNSKQAATEMAKLSSQFALISPGMDTTTSQEGLVSIMKAWNIGYQDVKSQIMDDINALGNAMAEDNQDIVEGMERSAAALAAVGTSTKDAFALFSGIQEVLQNSEKSGTSLRSVALRLRSFDESTEEYSSDLANITGELADLTKTAEHAQGISVFKPGSTTEFKSLVDYFREIADIWDEMSQKQQNDFLLKAFGRTQAQAGAALIQNFKGVEKALDVMDNAAGSADKEMETAKQSITYKLNELKQTWVGTVQDIANRDDLGKIVDGLTDLSSAIGFVIDKLGLVGTIGLFGGAGTGIFKFIKNFDWVFKPYTKTLQQFLVGQS